MTLKFFGSRKRKIAGAVILVIVVILAIFFATPIAGFGTSPEVSGGGSTVGGGFGMHMGAYQ